MDEEKKVEKKREGFLSTARAKLKRDEGTETMKEDIITSPGRPVEDEEIVEAGDKKKDPPPTKAIGKQKAATEVAFRKSKAAAVAGKGPASKYFNR